MCENINHEFYYDFFGELWDSSRYEQAIEIYELLGKPFFLTEDIGRYYENKGMFDRAMFEYEYLIETYLTMGDDFLPFPGGPVELYKVCRWCEKTYPIKAEKYLRLYLKGECDTHDSGRGIDFKCEAEEILDRIKNSKKLKGTIRYLTVSKRCDKKYATMKKKIMPRFRSEVPKGLFRVPISITKGMEDWLQDLSNQMKSSGGYKLPKSYIIRALLEAAMTLKIDVSNVKTEEDLVKRIQDSIKKQK